MSIYLYVYNEWCYSIFYYEYMNYEYHFLTPNLYMVC